MAEWVNKIDEALRVGEVIESSTTVRRQNKWGLREEGILRNLRRKS